MCKVEYPTRTLRAWLFGLFKFSRENVMQQVFKFGGTSIYGFAGKQNVRIDGRKIIITKGGIVNNIRLAGGEKSFDITQVSTIQIKKNFFLPGYLQFGLLGSQDRTHGLKNYSNENTLVIYNAEQFESAQIIKRYIEQNKEKFSSTGQTVILKSTAEQIREFKKLFDEGIITEEEFNRKKNQLINS